MQQSQHSARKWSNLMLRCGLIESGDVARLYAYNRGDDIFKAKRGDIIFQLTAPEKYTMVV